MNPGSIPHAPVPFVLGQSLQTCSPLDSAFPQCGTGAQSTEQDQAQALFSISSAGSRSCCLGHHPSQGVRDGRSGCTSLQQTMGTALCMAQEIPALWFLHVESFSPSDPTLLDSTYPQSPLLGQGLFLVHSDILDTPRYCCTLQRSGKRGEISLKISPIRAEGSEQDVVFPLTPRGECKGHWVTLGPLL